MLEDFSLLQIESKHFILQQGWVPPNCANIVCEFMNEECPRCWSGRGGREARQSHSPDRTSLNFYLWGYCTHNYSGKIF